MRIIRYVAIGLSVVVLLLGGAVGVLALAFPRSRPAPAEKVEVTPERVARGRYLFEHVAACASCHSERDFTVYAGPVKPGTSGTGMCFPEGFGMPGSVCAQNLTPDRKAGIGDWTDGEIIRAVREGIGRDGRALFPMMPYGSYRHMGDEDVRAIVAYLRSLDPHPKEVPPSRLAFVVGLAIKTAPQPLDGKPVVAPPPSDRVAYGRYLATIAACDECHSSKDVEFAGGAEFPGPAGVEVSANLTPDPETGMGKVSREEFIGKFGAFRDMVPSAQPGRAVMPWLAYAGMTAEDLGAIYDYLRTVKPVANAVARSGGR